MGMLQCSRKTNRYEPGIARVAAPDGPSRVRAAPRPQQGNCSRRAQKLETDEATMSLRVVRGLVEAVEQMGVSREELLRAAKLDPVELDDEEACVPRELVYALCEGALDLTGDPAFGLHWG